MRRLAGAATGAGALLILAAPVRAECLGESCHRALLWFLIGVGAYGLALLLGLGLLIWRKTRRAGLILLAVLAVLGVFAFFTPSLF
jgi:hypothetical protein